VTASAAASRGNFSATIHLVLGSFVLGQANSPACKFKDEKTLKTSSRALQFELI